MKGHDLATIFDFPGAPGGPTVWRRPNGTGIPRFLLGVPLADPGRRIPSEPAKWPTPI